MTETKEFGKEEGAVCNRDGCGGVMNINTTDVSCSCHIVAPCPACTTLCLVCSECYWEEYVE